MNRTRTRPAARPSRRLALILALVLLGGAITVVATARGGTARRAPPTYTTWIWHYEPGVSHAFLSTWREMLATLPADGRVLIATRSPRDAARVCRELGDEWSSDPRLTYVNVRANVTSWARDRYIAVEHRPERRILHQESGRLGARSRGDVFVPLELGNQDPGLQAVAIEHGIDGGDVLQTRDCVFLGAETVERCSRTAGVPPEDLTDELRGLFDRRLVVIHDGRGRVPWPHIDMFLTALDDGVLLLGDPRLALAHWPDRKGQAAAAKLGRFPRRLQEENVAVYDGVARLLREQGFTVHRIPVLHGNKTARNGRQAPLLSWNNVLLDSRADHRVVWLPRYGIASLDEAARRVWEGLGYRVHSIDTTGPIRFHGGLRCLTNVVKTVELKPDQAPFLPPPCGRL